VAHDRETCIGPKRRQEVSMIFFGYLSVLSDPAVKAQFASW
jgi:hypothetical protein